MPACYQYQEQRELLTVNKQPTTSKYECSFQASKSFSKNKVRIPDCSVAKKHNHADKDRWSG
jgi:hypothetical protein